MNFGSIIIGFGLGIIGSFFGALFSHFFSEHRRKKEEFNKAAGVFRAAFVEVIHLLRENMEDGKELISKILTAQLLIELEKAKILFEPFLDKTTLIGFNRAWGEYTECRHTQGRYNYSYSDGRTSDEDRKARSRYCLDHIDNLLDNYAKPKY